MSVLKAQKAVSERLGFRAPWGSLVNSVADDPKLGFADSLMLLASEGAERGATQRRPGSFQAFI